MSGKEGPMDQWIIAVESGVKKAEYLFGSKQGIYPDIV